MIEFRRRLADVYGENYARIALVDMCQRRGLDPVRDNVTSDMLVEAKFN